MSAPSLMRSPVELSKPDAGQMTVLGKGENITFSVVLSSDETILKTSHDPGEKRAWWQESIVGKPLREVLGECNRAWPFMLPDNLATLTDPVFLYEGTGKEGLPAGYIFSVLPFGELLFINMVPSVHPEGKLMDVDTSAFPVQDRALARLCIRLQTLEKRLGSFMKHMPGVFFAQKPDLSFDFIGDGFEELFGVDRESLYGSSSRFVEMISERDRDEFFRAAYGLKPGHCSETLHYRIGSADDGTLKHILDIRSACFAPGGLLLGFEGVLLNVTRQVNVEKRLTETSKREEIANVTCGLAHDFKNVMAGIYSLSDVVLNRLDRESPIYENMHLIREESRQAQQMVRRILDLSHSLPENKSSFYFGASVKEQVSLLAAISPGGCEVSYESDLSEDIPVTMDKNGLHQVLLNLAINAFDAMEGGRGRIEVSVRGVGPGDRVAGGFFGGAHAVEQHGVVLRVSDNGSGIPEAVQSKIFNAFFTTKDPTRGSGFGLYSIRTFAEDCGGWVDFTSVPGEGTTFELYFPADSFASGGPFQSSEQSVDADADTSGKRVLVFANERAEIDLLQEPLRHRGWEAVGFVCKEDAADFLSRGVGLPEVAVIVSTRDLDRTSDLFSAVKAFIPSCRVIIVSRSVPVAELQLIFGGKADCIQGLDSGIAALGSLLEQIVRIP